MTMKISTLPLIAALLALPGALAAQAPEAAPQPAPAAAPDSAAVAQIQGWLAELQTVSGRLQALQEQALQDAELNAAQEELGNRIRTAMEESDPSLVDGIARVEALQGEAEAAQQAGDQARLMELGAELQQFEARFVTAQQAALARPDISADLAAFETRLQARLTELDPEAPQLIARFQELQRVLSAAMGGGA